MKQFKTLSITSVVWCLVLPMINSALRIEELADAGNTVGQTSHRGDFSAESRLLDNKDYRNRAIRQPGNLRRAFGVTSAKIGHKRTVKKRKQPKTPEELINEVFNFEQWAPRRSTISPPIPVISGLDSPRWAPSILSSDAQIAAPGTRKTFVKHLTNHKVIPWQVKEDVVPKAQPMFSKKPTKKMTMRKKKMKIRKVTKGAKGFTPADDERSPVALLKEVLRKGKTDLRQQLIIRKLEETKQMVKQLETVHREKKKAIMNSANTADSAESLALEIEDQEIALRSGETDQLKYSIKDGLLYKEDKKPLARIRTTSYSLPGEGRRKKMGSTARQLAVETVFIDSQTKVASSPVLLEDTTVATTERDTSRGWLPVSVADGEVNGHQWVGRTPLRPPTIIPTYLTPRPVALGAPIGFEEHSNRAFVATGTTRRPERTKLWPIDNGSHPSNDVIEDTTQPPPYPFSHCFMNKDGFMCCNRYLESLMRRSYQKLKRTSRFHECSVQKIATRLQRDCEQVFNTTFEAIVGIDDFALRAHFAGDMMCKIEQDGRFITVYATAMPNNNGSPKDPLHTVTSMSLNTREDEFFGEDQLDNAPQHIIKDTNIPQNTFKTGRAKLPFHELSREEIDNERLFTNSVRK